MPQTNGVELHLIKIGNYFNLYNILYMDSLTIVLLITTILSFIANVIQAIFHVPPKCNSSCFNCCDEIE